MIDESPVSNLDFTSVFDGSEITNAGQSLSKEIGDTVGDLSNQVLTPVKTGADAIKDGVAFVGSNVKSFTTAVSNFKSEALGQISSLLKNMTNGFVDIDDIGGLIKIQNGKLTFDTDSLLRDLSKSVGFDITSMESLTRDISDTLNKQFDIATNGMFGDLFTSDGKKLGFNPSTNWRDDDIQQLISLIDRTSDSDDYVYRNAKDQSLDSAFNDSLLEQVVNNGMTDSYKNIYDRYATEEEAQAATISSIKFCLDTGNYYSLKALDELLIDSSYPRVKSTYPKLARTFIANYEFGNDDTIGGYDDLCKNVKILLAKLGGDKWWETSTEFGDLPDFTITSEISQDATTLFLLDEDLGKFIPAVGMFDDLTLMEAAVNCFPGAVIYND